MRRARSSCPGRAPHDLDRRRVTSEHLEAEGALAHEQFAPVDYPDAACSCRLHERGLSIAVHEINHAFVTRHVIGIEGQRLEPVLRRIETDRGAVDEQIGGIGAGRPGCRRARRTLRARARRVRFQTRTSRAPASSSAHTAARALPPAPSTSAVLPAGGERQRRDQAGRVGVVGANLPPPSKISVLAAPIAQARGVGSVGERQRRVLVRDRHVDAAKARPRRAPRRSRRTAPEESAVAGSASRRGRPTRAPRSASPASRLCATGQPTTPRRVQGRSTGLPCTTRYLQRSGDFPPFAVRADWYFCASARNWL